MGRSKYTQTAFSAKGKRVVIPDFTVEEFEGMVTEIDDETMIPDGSTPDELNWLTSNQKDNIQLRRGYALLGKTRRLPTTGKVSGLGVGVRYDGTQIPFFTGGKKIYYYDPVADDTIEVGVDSLPSAAASDDISISPYQNLAGSFVFLSSPNSSIYKIHTANPTTLVDLQSKTYRGDITVGQNRMILWNRKDIYGGKDQTGVYLSYIDKTTLTSYTQTTAEVVGAGDGSTKTFPGTLAFKAANAKATAMYTQFAAPINTGFSISAITAAVSAVVTAAGHSYVVGDVLIIVGAGGMTQINGVAGVVIAVTATTITLSINSSAFTAYTSGGTIYKTEFFTDDRNGSLSSVAGGTGTINYASGVFSLTFATAPTNGQSVYAQYYVEDSTNNGIADFSFSGTRVAGQGNVFRQDAGGGNAQVIAPFQDVEYCFHVLKVWALTLTQTDTSATNLEYRSNLGVPYRKAAYPTGEGIIFLDNSKPAEPRVRVLEIQQNSPITTVVPKSLSDNLDLSSFGFTYATLYRFGDYDMLLCQDSKNGVQDTINSACFIRNIHSGTWDKLDYIAASLDTLNGTLISGDFLANNIYTLFSGFDDDGSVINNYWTSKSFDLRVNGTKRFYRFLVQGLIQLSQSFDVYFAFDGGDFVKAYTISGNGNYVNKGVNTSVGSYTVGSKVVGGGASTEFANPFELDFGYTSDVFEYVQIKIVANGVGYLQVNKFSFKDIRFKGRHITSDRTV